MGIVHVELGRRGASGAHNKGEQRRYLATYKVRTDTPLDQVVAITDHFRDTPGLPYVGDPYAYANDSDEDAFCTSIAPTREETSQFHWRVDVTFETEDGGSKGKENEENPSTDGKLSNDPEKWLEQWDIGFTQERVPVEECKYVGGMVGSAALLMPAGKIGPQVNSAFVPFVPPTEKEIDIETWRRQFYRRSYDSASFSAYQGRVNSNVLAIDRADIGLQLFAAAFTLRVKSMGASVEWINGGVWWRHNFEFWKHPLTWRVQIVDRGLHSRAMSGDPDGRGGFVSAVDLKDGMPPIRRLEDAQGYPITEPVLFDGDGQPLITDAMFPDPVYLTWAVHPEVEFPLGLFGADVLFPL
jgi:hypothetical protein